MPPGPPLPALLHSRNPCTPPPPLPPLPARPATRQLAGVPSHPRRTDSAHFNSPPPPSRLSMFVISPHCTLHIPYSTFHIPHPAFHIRIPLVQNPIPPVPIHSPSPIARWTDALPTTSKSGILRFHHHPRMRCLSQHFRPRKRLKIASRKTFPHSCAFPCILVHGSGLPLISPSPPAHLSPTPP
jgi:hypothetical protein